tara:strand:- start:34 stop:1368 length:1335 start_codon:yes stop_codon:yes gene_type:complete
MGKYIYILIFFIVYSSWSQHSVKVPDFILDYYDSHSKTIKLLTNDKIYSVSIDDYSFSEEDFFLPRSFDSKNKYSHVQIKQKSFFVTSGKGDVFEIKKNKLIRIDQSNINNFLIGSTAFTHNDTLFKFGGYGYWTLFNKIIYFDSLSKQWELYKYNYNNEPPGLIQSQVFKISDDQYYFINGQDFMQGNPLIPKKNKHIYEFNFTKKKWDIIGESQLAFNTKKILNDEERILMFSKSREVLELIPLENKLLKYNPSSLNNNVSIDNNVYLLGNNFIYFSNIGNKLYLNFFPSDIFIKTFNKQVLFTTSNNILWLGVLLISFLLLFTFYLLKKKRNKTYRVSVSQDYISYKRKRIKINLDEFNTLKLFIQTNKTESNKLDDVIFKNKLSRASNYKNKKEIIFRLNGLLKELLNVVENPITSTRSDLDSRLKIFILTNFIKLGDKS